MTAALAREVTCTDCGTTFAGRVGGSRRCGPCVQTRVAAALRARRGDAAPVVEAVSPTPSPVVERVDPETPSVPSVLPEPAAQTAVGGVDLPELPMSTCEDCGAKVIRKDSRGIAPKRCKPCTVERNRERTRAASTEKAEARELAGPKPYMPAVSDRAARATAVLAEAMMRDAPACDGDDRFTAETSTLTPGDESGMLRLCRSCPLFDPCALVAATTKPAAGFWAGKHRSTRTRDTQEATA